MKSSLFLTLSTQSVPYQKSNEVQEKLLRVLKKAMPGWLSLMEYYPDHMSILDIENIPSEFVDLTHGIIIGVVCVVGGVEKCEVSVRAQEKQFTSEDRPLARVA